MVVRNYDADEALRSIGFSRRARTDADGWPVVTYEMDGPHHQRIEATCDGLCVHVLIRGNGSQVPIGPRLRERIMEMMVHIANGIAEDAARRIDLANHVVALTYPGQR